MLEIGEEKFIPKQYRQEIFSQCLQLQPNETVTYLIDSLDRVIEIRAIEIDSRYGKIAVVREEET